MDGTALGSWPQGGGCFPAARWSHRPSAPLPSQPVAADGGPGSLRQQGDCPEVTALCREVPASEVPAPGAGDRDSPFLETMMLRMEEMEVRRGRPRASAAPLLHPGSPAARAGAPGPDGAEVCARSRHRPQEVRGGAPDTRRTTGPGACAWGLLRPLPSPSTGSPQITPASLPEHPRPHFGMLFSSGFGLGHPPAQALDGPERGAGPSEPERCGHGPGAAPRGSGLSPAPWICQEETRGGPSLNTVVPLVL